MSNEGEYVSRQPPQSLAEEWRSAIEDAYGRVDFRRRMVDSYDGDPDDHRVRAVYATLADLRDVILRAADALRAAEEKRT